MLSIVFNKRSLKIAIPTALIIFICILYLNSFKNDYSTAKIPVTVPIHHRKNNSAENQTTRILCLILTTSKYWTTRAIAINQTWAPRCDRYFFITESGGDEKLTDEQIKIGKKLPFASIPNITHGYAHLTQKSNQAFLFAYENHFNDCNWFIKADDDTYLIIDNLRAFLSKQDSSEPVTFGYNFKVIVPNGYHSGGASYVLSREALRRFHEAYNEPGSQCRKDGGAEDVEIAKCLRSKGVYCGKSIDSENRELFHPLPFVDHFSGNFPDWLFQYAENPLQKHYNCCSDQSVSFHYVPPEQQYLMDFLLYKARSPLSTTVDMVRKKFNSSKT